MLTRQQLSLADKMLKLPIFPQAQIENTSCKRMMQTFNKKLQKKTSTIGSAEEKSPTQATDASQQDRHIQSKWYRKQRLFFVLLFHIRMIVRRNHFNKKQRFQVNCWGSCYCRIYTSMKDYQTLITDRGRPNLMMSFWGTVTFVRHSYIYRTCTYYIEYILTYAQNTWT